MSNETLENYKGDAHDIYLGKNRRLADPIFFPAPGRAALMIERKQKTLALEMEAEPDGPREMTRAFMSRWGWGYLIRYPPGDPNPRFEDYEKCMDAMAADVQETWDKIQRLVRNHEDDIQRWILDSYMSLENEEPLTNSSPYASMTSSWHPTVTAFNNCHPDISTFMEPNSIESDFHIKIPDSNAPLLFPFIFINRYFSASAMTQVGDIRNHHTVFYNHLYNFYDSRLPINWPHEYEPEPAVITNPPASANWPESREFYKQKRLTFLAPHIASSDLLEPGRLFSLIHSRGRQHPSVFAKKDNDMTFIGRRTNYLTDPLIANRMVSFDISQSGSVKSYRPELWKGWTNRPDDELSAEDKEEYDDLWHRGQLFAPSEAWIMLQSQRVTYYYLWHLLTDICDKMKLNPSARLALKSPKEQSEVLSNVRTTMSKEHHLKDWFDFARNQPSLLPPTQISPIYFTELQSTMEEAEESIRKLFNDPGFFFDMVYELREHHWGNIGMKSDEKSPDEVDQYSAYVEQYTNEQTCHMLYYDLIRGVVRRHIFEFYMWYSIYTRLREFESKMKETFPDYGKEGYSDTDGTNRAQQPPVFLSDKMKQKHAKLAEEYMSLVVLIRYHAIFFVNEFRKKGIHAGSPIMSHLVYSIGPPQEEIQDRACNIQKNHYYAPDLKYRSKTRDKKFNINKLEKNVLKVSVFDAIETFIVNPLDRTNCGIKEAVRYLQEVRQVTEDKREGVFTELIADTIYSLDILTSLADHLESLWPAMDRIGGGEVDETVRRKYFDQASRDISINFLHFDEFNFDKIPKERMNRLFLFFDELQGFARESISMGHAKYDLKRFGASLLRDYIYPHNEQFGGLKANEEAISRLEKAMGAEEIVAAAKRQRQRDAFIDLLESSPPNAATEKKRLKKLARRQKRSKTQAEPSGEPTSDLGKEKDETTPDVGEDSVANEDIYNPRWEESLHASLTQFLFSSIHETRLLAQSQTTAPKSNAAIGPAPNAPDGSPKGIIKKHEWATLKAIYGIKVREDEAVSVSYAQLKAAMEALGYKQARGRGSHKDEA
ncbi:uncharacterized protein TRIVIDRAFT_62758 [Trichoderma virens Gv29-8]|uniref:Uncharacterized protein n=1 Tax=Hypocrea virens (strain Gv29-8 / FGSC 10586) TaxID=413071 RepID=G9MEZ8_HYPVG|nr:uncharacterized protein TRIVIDRAFT_62758 [Trichoderma virens Gv29-8]EHK26966.1 hypothetical protein TRIVIDRAFT_62758 [Trichoderma virens Gv29-8]